MCLVVCVGVHMCAYPSGALQLCTATFTKIKISVKLIKHRELFYFGYMVYYVFGH